MSIDYDHAADSQTIWGGARGAARALRIALKHDRPNSILDVGCGLGTWLRAALDEGISDVLGVDAFEIPTSALLIPNRHFIRHDLTRPLDLGRRFDLAICVEVGEHLPAMSAETLIQSLERHTDTVLFSAACPGQLGQHHINCQWPEYWQNIFNMCGYICDDGLRWAIWDVEEIEPWYRQNVFVARRAPELAGKEARLKAVIHPEMLLNRYFDIFRQVREDCLGHIESGAQSSLWYVSLLARIPVAKLSRKLARLRRG